MNDLPEQLASAVATGQLLESSKQNIESLLAGAASDLAMNSVKELVASANFSELNDRFYKTHAYGTGGPRCAPATGRESS
jgi:phosphoglucomutase